MTNSKKEQYARIFDTFSKLPDQEQERLMWIAEGMRLSSELKEARNDRGTGQKSIEFAL